MYELYINKGDDFASAVHQGLLYLKLEVPYSKHVFSPLDIYREIIIHIPLANPNIEERLLFEIVEIYTENSKQYLVMREKSRKFDGNSLRSVACAY